MEWINGLLRSGRRHLHHSEDPAISPNCEMFTATDSASLYAALRLQSALVGIRRPPTGLVLRVVGISALDRTDLYTLSSLLSQCRRQGTTLVLSDVQIEIFRQLAASLLAAEIGTKNIHYRFERARFRANEIASEST